MDEQGLYFRPAGLDPVVPLDQFGAAGFTTLEREVAAAPACAQVELVGSHLRASGSVDLGNFHRLSDYVNFLTGFFTIRDVTLLSRIGKGSRIARSGSLLSSSFNRTLSSSTASPCACRFAQS